MPLGKEILLKLKTGEKIVFGVSDYQDFLKVLDGISGWWNKWVLITNQAAIRKDTIDSVYYFPEGYENRSRID